MAVTTADDLKAQIGSGVLSDRAVSLRRLQRQMLELVSTATNKSDLVRQHAELIQRLVDSAAVYFERNEEGTLEAATSLYPTNTAFDFHQLEQQVATCCHTACRVGEVDVRRLVKSPGIVVAAPVALRGRDPEAFAVIFPDAESPEQVVMLVQMAVSHFVLWHVLHDSRSVLSDRRDLAALVELLETVGHAPSRDHASLELACELQTYLRCARVAVGVRDSVKGSCRLTAISGVTHFDQRSQTARAIESAMEEAVLCDDITMWPPQEDAQHGARCHKSLCSIEDTSSALTIPLRDNHGMAIGALTLLDDAAEKTYRAARFLRVAEQPVATALSLIKRADGNRLVRLARVVKHSWITWQGKCAAALLILLVMMMGLPLPYRIRCDCQIEPVTHRFVATPYEGTLEKAFVRPGDVVSANELLAQMDGREVRWKRASVAADRNQAVKKRDAAQADHRFGDAQIAKLEIDRLDLELQLLDHQADNLEIRSPVAGIVASGDLERAEGAPLTKGQTLFEIAPLSKMIVQVGVSDEDVSFVRVGQTVHIRLDAYAGDKWQAKIARIQPRSEIRNEDNVFVAEAELDNKDGRLRPGMQGRAKVVTPRRPLGWILFHRPWDYLKKKLVW